MYKKIYTFSFYSILIILLLGFTPVLNPPLSGWYQQFLPNIGNRTISDITFIDSLNGYAIGNSTSDTNYFLKTTTGGDSWQITYRRYLAFEKLQFLNLNTGYMCGAYLWKTTDGGFNWNQVSAPSISPEGLYVIDENTIWIISSESLIGGVFFTSNGGASWQQQFSGGTQNPNKIYMFNSRIGFMTSTTAASPNIYKTSNGGQNWNISTLGEGFFDIHFIDSLLGWRCYGAGDTSMKKTTNGGINWVNQHLPRGGYISSFYSAIYKFSVLNQDTIFGVGGVLSFPNNQYRGIIYRTTNGGLNWLYQVPDTTIRVPQYFQVQFINKYDGWAYSMGAYPETGIHTTTGGDTNWLTGIKQIAGTIPKEYRLYQNYPNPFNPMTLIRYEIKTNVKSETSNVKINVYDITGKEIISLVNEKQNAGLYQVDFSATGGGNRLSSGVYFYSLIVDGNLIDTKKMLLIK